MCIYLYYIHYIHYMLVCMYVRGFYVFVKYQWCNSYSIWIISNQGKKNWLLKARVFENVLSRVGIVGISCQYGVSTVYTWQISGFYCRLYQRKYIANLYLSRWWTKTWRNVALLIDCGILHWRIQRPSLQNK